MENMWILTENLKPEFGLTKTLMFYRVPWGVGKCSLNNREKGVEMRGRAFLAWHLIEDQRRLAELSKLKEIEAARAKERQIRKPESVLVNLPKQTPINSRENADTKVGLSGKSAEKAAEVVEEIDAFEATGEKV